VSIIITALMLLLATISFLVAIFSYYNVYITYWNLTKSKKASQDNQRIVFYKCVAMTLCLVLLWSPYYVKVLFEIVTGRSIGTDCSAVATIFALLCPTLNPFILCYYDNRVRGNMLEAVTYFKELHIKKSEIVPVSLEKGEQRSIDTDHL
jgi:hypothetical protein